MRLLPKRIVTLSNRYAPHICSSTWITLFCAQLLTYIAFSASLFTSLLLDGCAFLLAGSALFDIHNRAKYQAFLLSLLSKELTK